MKKIFILLGLLTFFLTTCQDSTMNFTDIYPHIHVTKIEVTKGNGENTIITNQTHIDEWINHMQSITFALEEKQEKKVGYLYSVKMYNKDEEVGSFTTSEINGHYYKENTELVSAIEDLINKK
ncbi:hypothetical protein ACFQZ1_18630 [Bacillus sp. CGMCC 1.60114]|uniref:hypothetical protein n=1 Tax=unclassified Bacillus (in: firmicutes) TaxID=185979 RepID=UPI0036325479